MKLNKTNIIIIVTASVAFAIAYGASAGKSDLQSKESQPLSRWLQMTDDRAQALNNADPEFTNDSAQLADQLNTQRQNMIDLLESPDTTDDQILQQVEVVIETHNALERRAAKHLVAIRPYLTHQEQQKLMGLCANKMREKGQFRYGRHGMGMGQGEGRGMNNGGNGNGRGHGKRGGPNRFGQMEQ